MTRSSLSPFGALLAEIRESPARRDHARDVGRVSSPVVGTAPELDLRIETRVVSAPRRSTSGTARLLWPASVLVHAALLVALVVVPLLRSEALPTPVRETRAFFVAPGSPAMPPPPPPASRAAAAPRSTSRPGARPAPAPRFNTPADVPEPAAAAVADTGHGNLDLDEDAPRGVEMRVITEDCGSILLRFAGGTRGCCTVSQVTAGRKNCLRFEIAAASGG